MHHQEAVGCLTDEVDEGQPGGPLPVGLSGAEIVPAQTAGGNHDDEENHQDGDGVGGTVAGVRHTIGNRPRTDDAEEDGASAPGGGLDAQLGSGGRVAASPGGASVPVGQRSPGGFGGLKGREGKAGGLKELVPDRKSTRLNSSHLVI